MVLTKTFRVSDERLTDFGIEGRPPSRDLLRNKMRVEHPSLFMPLERSVIHITRPPCAHGARDATVINTRGNVCGQWTVLLLIGNAIAAVAVKPQIPFVVVRRRNLSSCHIPPEAL